MNTYTNRFYYVLRGLFDGVMVLALNTGTQYLFCVPLALIVLAIPVAIIKRRQV